MKFQTLLGQFLADCGAVETAINGLPGNNPTPAQSALLALLQGQVLAAVQACQNDPALATQNPPTP